MRVDLRVDFQPFGTYRMFLTQFAIVKVVAKTSL
jgi:hypothetical protein